MCSTSCLRPTIRSRAEPDTIRGLRTARAAPRPHQCWTAPPCPPFPATTTPKAPAREPFHGQFVQGGLLHPFRVRDASGRGQPCRARRLRGGRVEPGRFRALGHDGHFVQPPFLTFAVVPGQGEGAEPGRAVDDHRERRPEPRVGVGQRRIRGCELGTREGSVRHAPAREPAVEAGDVAPPPVVPRPVPRPRHGLAVGPQKVHQRADNERIVAGQTVGQPRTPEHKAIQIRRESDHAVLNPERGRHVGCEIGFGPHPLHRTEGYLHVAAGSVIDANPRVMGQEAVAKGRAFREHDGPHVELGVVHAEQPAAHRSHFTGHAHGGAHRIEIGHAAQPELILGPVPPSFLYPGIDPVQRERGPDARGRALDAVPRDGPAHHLRKLFRRLRRLAEIDVELPRQKFKFRFREWCKATGGLCQTLHERRQQSRIGIEARPEEQPGNGADDTGQGCVQHARDMPDALIVRDGRRDDRQERRLADARRATHPPPQENRNGFPSRGRSGAWRVDGTKGNRASPAWPRPVRPEKSGGWG